MAQLKMYWFTKNDVPEIILPEGYSFSNFRESNRDIDIHDWNESIRTWDKSDETDEQRFTHEIYNFKDIVPERDVWFIDYKGEHVGTATSFIWGETGVGDMHWVGIKKEFRGKGLSKYLVWKIMATLKERGTEYVSLTTGEGRPAAVKCYLTAGFLPVEYDEGMVERWENVLKTYNIDSIQMLNEDATPFKTIYKKD